jgi:hypothetical protein
MCMRWFGTYGPCLAIMSVALRKGHRRLQEALIFGSSRIKRRLLYQGPLVAPDRLSLVPGFHQCKICVAIACSVSSWRRRRLKPDPAARHFLASLNSVSVFSSSCFRCQACLTFLHANLSGMLAVRTPGPEFGWRYHLFRVDYGNQYDPPNS